MLQATNSCMMLWQAGQHQPCAWTLTLQLLQHELGARTCFPNRQVVKPLSLRPLRTGKGVPVFRSGGRNQSSGLGFLEAMAATTSIWFLFSMEQDVHDDILRLQQQVQEAHQAPGVAEQEQQLARGRVRQLDGWLIRRPHAGRPPEPIVDYISE